MRIFSIALLSLTVACDPKTDDTSAPSTDDPPVTDVDPDADADADDTGDAPVDADADADDTGEPAPIVDDVDGDGFTVEEGDCDDDDASISPIASETCNGIDDNCDGSIDEGVTTTVFRDLDGDGFGDLAEPLETCDLPIGYVATSTDCDDSDPSISPVALEVCDGIDNDCDDLIDDSALDDRPWYPDMDGDGHGDASGEIEACDAPADHVRDDGDCDDADASIHPDAEEFCDDVDNDCDGSIDERSAFDAVAWYTDADGDGFGDGTATLSCDSPLGAVDNNEDCDDSDADINPDADEICDDIDNDCDGDTDEDGATDALTWYRDADDDGFGDADGSRVSCELPSGYVESSDDCDDDDIDVNPDGVEVCDDVDNDCDGITDEADAIDAPTWYVDGDGDGYGAGDSTTRACSVPLGYADNDDDCNDESRDAYPGGTEVCDGLDNDCDGVADGDDAEDVGTWFIDEDGDGFGDSSLYEISCDMPDGYTDDDSDCDDSSTEAFPGGTEVCDGLDNDCDGEVDGLDECSCDLVDVSDPTNHVSRGSTYGAWMQDPLETLGENLVWEFNGHNGSSVTRYNSMSDFVSGSSSSSSSIGPGWDGTGQVVYDGYLYFNQSSSRIIGKMDLDTGSIVDTLEIPDAGYRNTYHYQWGGWSDIDLAVDEEGLWVIYSTPSNGGRLVLSKIDVDSFNITDTWNTSSEAKTNMGNAFMICGVLYATDSYSDRPTTINFRFDPVTGDQSNPGIRFENPGGYNSSISYNPLDQKLYSWDSTRHQTYDLTLE